MIFLLQVSFLITRYEEYLPHVKDHYERFNAEQSIAYKFQFLEKPIVDIWAKKLSVVLLEKFPNFEFPERTFKYISTLDIDNAFAYKYKSFIRSTGGLINDFFRLNLRVFWDRLTVLLEFEGIPMIFLTSYYHSTLIIKSTVFSFF